MQHIEDNEQTILFRWARFQSGKYPELDKMFHIPNGGKRNAREGARFKMMGVKAGVPDIFLPAARGGYHGLFVEMKADGGRTSKAQDSYISALKEQGYCVKVCFGWEKAAEEILKYLEGEAQGELEQED